jgi:hypothetical protein
MSIIRDFKNAGVKVITVILTPRPYVLTSLMEISDAVMLVYRGGNGIGQAVAECIFGDFAPSGKLPFQMPKSLAQLGSDNTNNMVEKWDLPYDLGANETERIQIRNYMKQGVAVPPIFGDPLFQYGFGIQGFGVTDETPPTAFELLTPIHNFTAMSNAVTFTWQPSSDPESSIAYYELYIDNVKRAEVTSTTHTENILDNGVHNWFVKAVNGAGLKKNSTSTFSFSFGASGLNATNVDVQLRVYPNPFNKRFAVEIKNASEPNQFKITDATGKIVLEKTASGSVVEFDMSGLQSGAYFLVITNQKETKTIKVIKNYW